VPRWCQWRKSLLEGLSAKSNGQYTLSWLQYRFDLERGLSMRKLVVPLALMLVAALIATSAVSSAGARHHHAYNSSLSGSKDNQYFTIANQYYYKRDYDRAIENYTEAIRLDPNNSNAYNGRGNAYYSKRDYDRAIERIIPRRSGSIRKIRMPTTTAALLTIIKANTIARLRI
jgi:tetratricopeptide (TPR) repeat protein